MNYQRIYDSIIEKAIKENRLKSKVVYYESHHILPACLGGSNKKENRVLLTPKEHFICHLLLVKIYEKKDKRSYIKMLRAFVLMSTTKNKEQENRYLNSLHYNRIKTKLYGDNGLLSGENAPFYGKKLSDEGKEKVRVSQTQNNSMKGKHSWKIMV